MSYETKQGDMWDAIAFAQLGDAGYTDRLINLNQQYIKCYIFPAGITLQLPEISPEVSAAAPPWKRGNVSPTVATATVLERGR